MLNGAWPKLSFFPMVLAGLVVAGALAINLVSPSPNPESSRIAEASQLLTRAKAAYAHGNWVETRHYAGQAVALNPSHVTARLILGLAHMNLNEYAGAEAEFRRVLAMAEKDRGAEAWAHNNLGVAFQRRGQLPQAVEEYRTALIIDPFNEQARANLDQVQRLLR